MILNWTPEVIIDILLAIILFILAVLTYEIPTAKKIKSLFHIRLGFTCFSLFFLFEGLSFLFMNIFLNQIHSLILLPMAFFFFIGINYIMRDSAVSMNLIPLFLFSIPFIYLIFLPESYIYTFEYGYLTISWSGLLFIVGIVIQLILATMVFYWGLKTYINTPFLIKKEAKLFFLGTFLASICANIIYLFTLVNPIFVIFTDIIFVIGVIIFILAIIKEPKLLYILPFTIYRIIVKERNGFPLFDHDWSKSEVSETLFTGFINAVQLMSQEVMDVGGLVNIQLEEGILILHESKLITVGLVASKSSKLLRETLIKFSTDFQNKFEKELKESCVDMSRYEAAYELIEKYFSNFPYRIISSRKQILLLSGKYAKIPLELDNKLKTVFKDQEQYEKVKSELIKTPISFPSEFLQFYDEMKKKIISTSQDEQKYIDWEFDEND
ncbi:MAG: hypothetical protein GF353_25700 [Candidatus Lokiarchaeota archaeon]|nr:hypothetical protein [Candidatus Lokiarchaeota archaeon]